MRTVFFLLICPIHLLLAQVYPQPPLEFMDACLPMSSNEITVCESGCNYSNAQLQTAINNAQPGTAILLQPGMTYVGPYTLPEKTGDDWIVIRTNIPDDQLPLTNQRIDPSYAPVLAAFQAKPNLHAISTGPRAHHYYFFGLEFRTEGFSWNVITIGNGETNLDDLPHDLVFDRIYLHGHPTLGSRRGIAMNGRRIAVVNSYLSNFKEQGADSQALCAWNGTTFKIVNNRLEGAGENIMFGGAKTQVPNMLMADIEFRNNHVIKPLAWRVGHPDYEGIHWSIKNLFELKNATRVWVKGNVFEQNWADAQTGFAILFTPRTEGGACPWITVSDVHFEHNIIRHTGSGLNIAARDNSLPTIPTARIWIHDNLIEDINGTTWGGDGRSLQVLSGVTDLTVDHNTWINPYGNSFVEADGPSYPNNNFIYTNNITSHGKYGLHGSGKGVGNGSLNAYFPNAVFTDNVIGDGINTVVNPGLYPPGNYFPGPMASPDFIQYNNGIGGDYRWIQNSPYSQAGSDGLDIGANIDSLDLLTDPAVVGIFPICSNTTALQLQDITSEKGLRIFPNPGLDHVEIQTTEGNILTADQIQIMDQMGHRIAFVKVTCADNTCRLDTALLPPGAYVIHIQDEKRVTAQLWIKMLN
ncbi:MAG: T9SS type A sorting domain-containing protein [Saprospiraceae bacterium]|nr:T9SS type A sorting domain-containing protein [Saprospiraceae bacterium]